jgi:RNA polymerase sigma-70 factor (ECF subfamily)
MDEKTALFETHRRVLEGLAYRMLGTLADAQDVVQETYLKWRDADLATVREPRAWLVTVCSRLAINAMKSARSRRETYVGTWLPEPLIDESAFSPADQTQIDETVSVALMLSLEKLSPLERAAFLLHEVFDYGFDEIATILGKTSAACRKLASRARLNLKAERPRFETSAGQHRKLVQAFLDAARAGEVESLQKLLADDVELYADGGGKVQAIRDVLHGAQSVGKFFIRVWRPRPAASLAFESVCFNGAPGLLVFEDENLVAALTVRAEGGRIAAIYALRNPDKLAPFSIKRGEAPHNRLHAPTGFKRPPR